MKDKRIAIIMIAVLVIIILFFVISLLVIKNSNKANNQIKTDEQENIVNVKNEMQDNEMRVEEIADNETFYKIENCIKKFESYVNLDYNKQKDELGNDTLASEYKINTEEQKKEAILNFINRSYISTNNINETNILSAINSTEKETSVEAIKINQMKNSSVISTYVAYVKKQVENNISFLYYVVSTNENGYFCIYPINANQYKDINDIKNVFLVNDIQENERNTVVENNLTDGKIAERYFLEYKEKLLNNTQEAYNSLNTEYKNKKFGNIQNFQIYINKNFDNLKLMQVYSYKITKENGYREYKVKCSYGRNMIFIEKLPKQFNVMLDDYTYITKSYEKEYNKMDDKTKVNNNIETFIQMINNKDYNQAYSKLNQEYKQSKINTEIIFENLIKERFYDTNSLEIIETQKENEYYYSTIKLKNSKDTSKKDINMTIVMKLTEKNDFEMSFSFDEN